MMTDDDDDDDDGGGDGDDDGDDDDEMRELWWNLQGQRASLDQVFDVNLQTLQIYIKYKATVPTRPRPGRL